MSKTGVSIERGRIPAMTVFDAAQTGGGADATVDLFQRDH
jgi:hypothetical protein